jgi:hypothetical protein
LPGCVELERFLFNFLPFSPDQLSERVDIECKGETPAEVFFPGGGGLARLPDNHSVGLKVQ